jgi:hypothetical protein
MSIAEALQTRFDFVLKSNKYGYIHDVSETSEKPDVVCRFAHEIEADQRERIMNLASQLDAVVKDKY